jgi:deazaflavin-dependent oxidoreductase (nitroreductase family)
MEDDLVAAGRVARIDMRGRRSGRRRTVTVGFVDGSDGSVVVAAGSSGAAWADNLLAEPACRVTIGARSFDALAEPLDGPDFAAAVRDLILRYGTPSEGLGSGPAFRLTPVVVPADAPAEAPAEVG